MEENKNEMILKEDNYQILSFEDLINSDLLESGCSEYTAKDYKKALSEFLIKYKSLEARVGIMSWYEDTFYGNLKEKYVNKNKIKEKIEDKISCCNCEILEDNGGDDVHGKYWKMYKELLEKLKKELLEDETK